MSLEERKVLFFLLSLLVIGFGLSYLNKKCSPLSSSLKDISQEMREANKMDLNKIDKETLIRLPGIGEKLACRIIEYRQNYGRFRDLEELKKIKGIRPSCYEKIKEYLYVR
ncbi:MAG: helix-hairpin-helix domain-containing protein [Candidatus Omnitrophica bacterium]|nr:helix-hairpin-helix domain-containing protein [Candidatus Omnitrophota bacterium]MCM8800079.1 helix-hairpin-helix domain-containing protein [Candidatus Omnitrophota bacterium]